MKMTQKISHGFPSVAASAAATAGPRLDSLLPRVLCQSEADRDEDDDEAEDSAGGPCKKINVM